MTSAQIQSIADILKTTTPAPVITDGATLYANNCASCHGVLASSAKLGATALQIQNGISSVSGMHSLSSLTTAQIQSIADILKTTTPAPVITDGATLYANNCASCHAILASSAKLGSTALQIQNGISTVSGMHSLTSLTSAQIQSIADILKTTTPGPAITDGSTLYANNCASCHGILASSAKLGSTALQIQNGISTVNGMHSLTSLTSAQIQSIADILKTTTPAPVITDGATLYANNCASCHGSITNSQVKRSSTVEIQQAIKNKSKMKFLSTLTTTQIQAIAGALGGK